ARLRRPVNEAAIAVRQRHRSAQVAREPERAGFALLLPQHLVDRVIEGVQPAVYGWIMRVHSQRVVVQEWSSPPKPDHRPRPALSRSAPRRGVGSVVSPLLL